MDARPHPPKLVLGVESGTAVLAVLTCVTFAVIIFALTGSFLTAGLATLALTAAIPLTSRILPSHSVPFR
ncbi:hypothetical protein [Nocardia wallacei]|uniref:hypothetical protein n=1 Tax=Nocardia wallacei TaxID=480035 RepID=UPI002457070B|nr:hypothetical protein [Nocardia wallacei]